MSTPLFEVTEGWTQELGPFTLKAGADVESLAAVALTGFTVALILRDDQGTLITVAGTVRIATDQIAEKGNVYFTPDAADFTWRAGGFLGQDFQMHWKVIDGAAKVVYFPNGEPDVIRVFRK